MLSRLMSTAYVATALAVGSGCGGAIHQTRTTLEITATALREVDVIAAREYTSAAETALESSETVDEYTEKMTKWDDLVRSANMLRAALTKASELTDVAERMRNAEDAQDRLTMAMRCAGYAVSLVIRSLEAVGIPTPKIVQDVFILLGEEAGACGDS